MSVVVLRTVCGVHVNLCNPAAYRPAQVRIPYCLLLLFVRRLVLGNKRVVVRDRKPSALFVDLNQQMAKHQQLHHIVRAKYRQSHQCHADDDHAGFDEPGSIVWTTTTIWLAATIAAHESAPAAQLFCLWLWNSRGLGTRALLSCLLLGLLFLN